MCPDRILTQNNLKSIKAGTFDGLDKLELLYAACVWGHVCVFAVCACKRIHARVRPKVVVSEVAVWRKRGDKMAEEAKGVGPERGRQIGVCVCVAHV